MRFLLDAKLSPKLARNFKHAGHEALHVFNNLLSPSADDLEVAALANQLGASVITKDADFADLARRGLLERPLIWLRIPNISTDLMWTRLDMALPDIIAAASSNQPILEVF